MNHLHHRQHQQQQEQYKQQQEQEELCSMARESREEKPSNMVSSVGFCYSDVSSNNPTIQTHLVNQMQSFVSNPELFNLNTSVDMLGFPSKNLHQRFISTGFSETTSENLIVAPHSAWQENRFFVEDSSQRCVFPCEGNERPSQGLSLSLCSNEPSSIGLQSFELRATSHQNDDIRFISSSSRDGFFGKFANHYHQQQQTLQDGFSGKAANLHQTHFQLKNSNYLAPAQQLLNQLCNLEAKQTDPTKQKSHKTNQREDENGGGSSRNQYLYSLDLLELQKRKSKLFSMLETVDRRYRHYCDQMKAVVVSFEEGAGTGAALVYSALASKTMSKHFRCLRDGIVGQIQATKKAMGEKDPVALGTTKGETPRLRLLDRTLRQQRAFQQMGMLESHPWRPQRGLPEQAVSVLRAWLFEHFLYPYPSDVDKHILARQTGLSRSQVSNWFINARVRLWKPMVEEMYLEETKEQDNKDTSDGVTGLDDNVRPNQNHQTRSEEQKPTPDELVRVEFESLSSIIGNPEKTDVKNTRNPQNDHHHHHYQQQLQQHEQQFGRVTDTNGVIDFDFSSYNNHPTSSLSYTNGSVHRNFGNGVSLTLGLQQQGGSGVSLAFSPTSQHSLFYPRDHIEDCQPVEYSILDGEAQNLPYRNLMEAQLLHDFTG